MTINGLPFLSIVRALKITRYFCELWVKMKPTLKPRLPARLARLSGRRIIKRFSGLSAMTINAPMPSVLWMCLTHKPKSKRPMKKQTPAFSLALANPMTALSLKLAPITTRPQKFGASQAPPRQAKPPVSRRVWRAKNIACMIKAGAAIS